VSVAPSGTLVRLHTDSGGAVVVARSTARARHLLNVPYPRDIGSPAQSPASHGRGGRPSRPVKEADLGLPAVLREAACADAARQLPGRIATRGDSHTLHQIFGLIHCALR
jgi:hypothetical protein